MLMKQNDIKKAKFKSVQAFIRYLRIHDMYLRIHVGEKFALPAPDNHSPDAE